MPLACESNTEKTERSPSEMIGITISLQQQVSLLKVVPQPTSPRNIKEFHPGMTKLAPFLPFDPVETSFSFASRLAALHTNIGVGRLFADLGIKPALFHAGDPEAITRLAELAGTDPATLLHNTFRLERQNGQLRSSFRGESFGLTFIRYAGLRICPECLMEDRAGNPELSAGAVWKTRYLWHFRAFVSCPRHSRKLVMIARSWPMRQNHDLATMFATNGLSPEKLLKQSPRREISPLQNYLQSRVNGLPGTGGPWLDGQTLEQAVEVCEALGLGIVCDGKIALSEMTPEDWDRAGAIGFEHARQGPEAIEPLLDKICDTYPPRGRQPPDRSIYGPLYTWLRGHDRRTDLGPVLDVVRGHMLKRIPFPAGTTLLGQKLEHRNLHSLQSLALERGMSALRLRGILESRGVVSIADRDKRNGSTLFPAAAGEAALDDLADMLLLINLPAYLNCRNSVARRLAEDGILKPASGGTLLKTGTGRNRQRVQFRREDLDAFLARLIDATDPIDQEDPAFGDIHTATKHAGCTATQVLADILAGDLTTGRRVEGVPGINGLRVRIADVLACRNRLAPPEGMNFSQAMKFLGVSFETLTALTNAEISAPLLPTYVPATKFGDGVRRYIRLPDLEAFAKKYVTIRELSRAQNISVRSLQNKLAREGVKEIEPRTVLYTSIYRREDVEA